MDLHNNAFSFINGIRDGYIFNAGAFVGFFIGNVIYYNWLPNYNRQYKYIIGPTIATTLYIAYSLNGAHIHSSTNNFFYLVGASIPTFFSCRSIWLLRYFDK